MIAPSGIKSTKLVAPASAVELRRPRIHATLAELDTWRLLLVSAPAGFGKSTLLSQLCRDIAARGASVCWISLEAADGDVAQLALYMVHAVRRVLPSFGRETLTLLTNGLPLPAAALTNSLLDELAQLTQPLYVAFDDHHLIAGSAAAALIHELALAPLPRLHFLVATRAREGLPLARLRVQGRLIEIDAERLKFSAEEAADLMAATAGLQLSPAELTLLHERTEGWVAGLQLASIALAAARDPAQLLRDFSGAHRDVGDFLTDEVFRQQRPAVQDFLLQTSLLDRFNVELCSALTGAGDARALLDEIERINLFLFSLDERRGWYRYHHLFQEFLQARLQDTRPSLVAPLHRRAAEWLARHGHLEDAMEHAFAAQDYGFAALWLDRSCQSLFGRGLTTALERYTQRLPLNIALSLPRLQLVQAWGHMLSWRFDAARESLDAARQAIRLAPGGDEGVEAVLAHREMMVALTADDIATAHRAAREWLARYKSDDGFMVASAGTAVLQGDREFFRHDELPARARALREVFEAAGADYGTVFHDSVASAALVADGRLQEAEACLRRAMQTAVRLHGPESPLAAMPSSLLAAVLYERDELGEAQELVEAYGPLADRIGFVDTLAAARLTEARLAHLHAAASRARHALEDTELLAGHYRFERLRVLVLAEQIRQLVAAGDAAGAQTLYRRCALERYALEPAAPDTRASVTQALLYCAGARVAPDAEAAAYATCLDAWLHHAKTRRSLFPALHLSLSLAEIESRQGKSAAAAEHLLAALALAAPRGYFRTVLDYGGGVIELLERLPARDLSPALRRYAESLRTRHAQESCAHGAARSQEAPLLEPLTARELEILRLAAQSWTNREIAGQLHLSETTVKWYWRRILQKMAVERRQQAVRKGRALGFIR